MQLLDEKKSIIIQILDRLRQFNPAIGNYDKSILTENTYYAVKLDNGRIKLSHELVYDYEQSPAFVNDEQLKNVASAFEPTNTGGSVTPSVTITTNTSSKFSPTHIPPTPKKKSSSRTLIILGVLIVLGLGGYYLYTKINREKETIQVEDNKSTIKNNINDYVTVENNEYRYNELGGIYGLEVTVTNSTDYTMDNVKVRITYIKKNGEVWKNHDVDFEMVGPRTSMTMKISDTDRGTSVKCRIISVKSSSLGL